MSKLSQIFFATVLGFCFLSETSAAVVQYDYSASVLSETRNGQTATPEQQFFAVGDLVSGSFTYDNGVSSLPEDGLGTFYLAMTNLLGSINGNSFSDSAGIVAIANDIDSSPDDPTNPLFDVLSIVSGLEDFDTADLNGFSIGSGGITFELVSFQLTWIDISLDGFLMNEQLPGSLPPAFNGFGIARLMLDFVDVNDVNNTHSVTADSIVVTAVPVPAAIWMFLGAVGLLGAAGSRRNDIASPTID